VISRTQTSTEHRWLRYGNLKGFHLHFDITILYVTVQQQSDQRTLSQSLSSVEPILLQLHGTHTSCAYKLVPFSRKKPSAHVSHWVPAVLSAQLMHWPPPPRSCWVGSASKVAL